MKYLKSIIPAGLIALSSCSKEGCNQPYAFNYDPNGTSDENCLYEPLPLRIEFDVVFGDEPVALNEPLTNQDGRTLQFSHFGIYFSEISITDIGEKSKMKDSVFLLLDSNRTYEVDYRSKGNISQLSFNIGVDSITNTTVEAVAVDSGPLSPQIPSMYWAWATGYRFVSLNGIVDTSTSMNGSGNFGFQYHTGLNRLLRSVTFDEGPVRIDNALVYKVKVDLQEALANVDMPNELSTHTSDNFELAQRISNNMVNAITLDE